MLRARALLCCLLAFSACRKPGGDCCTNPPQRHLDTELQALAEFVLDGYFERYPLRAVVLGKHEHDGRIRDCSGPALTAELTALRDDLAKLRGLNADELTPFARVELAALITTLDAELFELEVRRSPWTNPMFYMADLELTAYIARDYAPLRERGRAVTDAAKAGVGHLAHAQTNLEPTLARPFVDTALLQVRGTLSFVETDVPAAFVELEDPVERRMLSDALTELATALREFEAFLLERQTTASDEFALGPERYVEMLARTQGIELDLFTLRRVAEADLARNFAQAEALAMQIDPHKSTAEVMAMLAADKPAPDQVLAVATEQATMTQEFLIDQQLVTIPSQDVAIVTQTPPFMRWNFAFLDPAGYFEKAALPSFYYISPPDPTWTPEQQREYLPDVNELLFITVHEVWPGHFLHGLHIKSNRSPVLRALWNNTTGEGWAHYAEAMMADAGLGENNPRVRLGQLQNALLRNVRFVVALGLHTDGMTVEQATELFQTKAFQDPVSARQQAVRGTFDPMYLGYTLGKLIVLALRDDWQAQQRATRADDSLRRFHDELLSYGVAPLPAIREAMVGREGALID
jgi:uncharacterized protein (DUF885 family)